MMVLVSEVHPFADGNGRIARIMMNAELVARDQQRIIIPTGLRQNYLRSLTGLSRNDHATGLIRALDFAHRYSAQIDSESRPTGAADPGGNRRLRGERRHRPHPAARALGLTRALTDSGHRRLETEPIRRRSLQQVADAITTPPRPSGRPHA